VIFEEGGEKRKVKTKRPKQRTLADFI
jgi:hypothetical protein